jgi:hypothetical protein
MLQKVCHRESIQLKRMILGQVLGLTPVILATGEAESRRIAVQVQPQQIV